MARGADTTERQNSITLGTTGSASFQRVRKSWSPRIKDLSARSAAAALAVSRRSLASDARVILRQIETGSMLLRALLLICCRSWSRNGSSCW